MGKAVKCPYCGSEFHVHGAGQMAGQEVVRCYECDSMFNHRKQSDIPDGD